MSEETRPRGTVENPKATARSSSGAGTEPSRGGPFSGGLGLIVFFVLIGAAGYLTYRAFYPPPPPYPTPDPPPVTYMCSESQKTFPHRVVLGEKIPVESPHSKKKTGYPAEMCFCWDAAGKPTRSTPCYVIHNKWLGKEGDPVCPDCKKPVREHNTELSGVKPGKKTATTQGS